MKKYLNFIGLFILFSPAFAVQTRFINDLKFDRIDSFTFSNICFYQDGSIGLTPPVATLYSDKEMIWSFARHKGKSYLGTGATATVVELDDNKRRTVYQDTNASLVSEIVRVFGGWALAQIPDNKVYFLTDDFKISYSVMVTNRYVWGLLPYQDGMVVTGGQPAALSIIRNHKSKVLALLSNEKHLLKVAADGDVLYFGGESTLYRYEKGKVGVVASFDHPLSDFILDKGVIYLITSDTRSGNNKTDNSSKLLSISAKDKTKQKNNPFASNALYKIVPGEFVQLLLEQKGLTFLSIDKLDNKLIIGSDKDGGYFTYSLANKTLSYSALGSGSFMKMFEEDSSIYGILVYPSEVVRFDAGVAASGWVQSDIQDTGNLSRWGTPLLKAEIPAGTFVHLHTRSGAVSDTTYWDDWIAASPRVRSLPNRYLQYRINLSSNGKLSPRVRGVSIPFVQNNLPPAVKDISVDYQNQGVKISWNTEDPNNDDTDVRLFLRNTVNEEVSLTTYPLRVSSYNLNYSRFASGKYRLRIVVSDAPSNPVNSVLSTSKLTPFFYIDSDAPVISTLSARITKRNGFYRIRFSAKDALIPIGEASYTLNGGKSVKLSPSDGIFDQKSESFDFEVRSSLPVFLSVQVSDRLGNTASRGIWLK